MEITSLELSILEEEFSELEGGHVQKVYQRGEELTLEIYVPGEDKKRLIIGTDRAFISRYKRDNPQRPPGFAMELRKHLGKVTALRQKGFDRILVLESGDVRLVCELFGKGNFILVKEGDIIGALREEEWADREIRVGLEYRYPEEAEDPREGDYIKMLGEGEAVRRLASDLSLGGAYAEEVCSRADIEKHRKISELSEEEKASIEKEVRGLFDAEKNPQLYVDDLPVRASPFPLETYSEYSSESFKSFSRALDEYYYRRKKKQHEKKKREKYREKLEGLKRQREQQERKIQGLKKSAEKNREKAEMIYENYRELHEVKKAVEKGVEKQGWDSTRQKLDQSDKEKSEKINALNEQNGFFSYSLGDETIKIYLFQDLEATASQFYDKAKESESKIESTEKALKQTKNQIKNLEQEEIEIDNVMEDKSKKRSKKWFEKYRWFRSSEGHMVVIGRDAQNNEMLVKKHMEPGDIYMHVDFDGGPSVVVKNGQKASEKSLKEAATAAVTFTKAWKAGIGAADVYYVEPEQVTKNPESGEYLSKGAFVIRGDRDYFRNVSVDAWIGPYNLDNTSVPMCGPEEAVKKHCEDAIKLRPGNEKKSEVAKEVNRRYQEHDLDLDYIIRSLPPGKSEIS